MQHPEEDMAKKARGGVYRIVDVVGVSKNSWEDAGRRAVETAATSIRDLRIAEVTKMDMTVENGKYVSWGGVGAPGWRGPPRRLPDS
jgi:flavin-binding protein dodecin